QGSDVHRLVEGRALILGGVEIPFGRGLEGHSDGDALLHAVASALLGALGDGDLGRHFPSSDPKLAGIASTAILARVAERMRERGFRLANLDATIVAQAPRLAPHLDKMRAVIADVLGVDADRVNVKVTSTDELGAIGRGEGIAAQAVALLVEADARG
ncbi:MAG TPA: 2-C-methyl-D-erythritol 2,4-cyclodiphosphate synthase, partial [Myxococcota bacterium]|nr:2-C-methyl-D-erythritol 2,4-cyclodiphosphate synthase [Myxococcota bacterium]